MRIGLTTSVIQRGRTGIAQWVFAMVRALQPFAADHDFVLFVLEEDLPLFDFAAASMELVPVSETYRSPVRDLFWHQVMLPGLARRHQLDVIHVPSYRRLPWASPCKRVGTIHDLAPFRLSGKYDWKRMLFGRVVVPFLARRQHRLVAVSQFTAADIHTFLGIDPAQVSVILNGVDHARFCPEPAPVSGAGQAEDPSPDAPYLLYVARLEHPAKNHLRLIRAFSAYKERTGSPCKLVLAGSDWDGADVIHEAIAASPVREDIRCLGFVPDADLPQLYRQAQAFLFPSLFEGFGMPPIEAMACGAPVICSPAGALGEIVGAAALLVDPASEESIRDALERLETEPATRNRLIEAGLERAQQFRWDEAAAELMEVYETVTGPAPTTRLRATETIASAACIGAGK